MEKLAQERITIMACVLVKRMPATNTLPTRIKVKAGYYPWKVYSLNTPEGIDSREEAQYFAEKRMRELDLNWVLGGGGYVEGEGLTIFTLK